MKKQEKNQLLKVKVDLKDLKTEQGSLKLAAYVFSNSGRLIQKTSLKAESNKPNYVKGEIKIKSNLDNLVVKVGPDIEVVELLDKYKPIAERVSLSKLDSLEINIDKPFWICWLKRPYFVKGKVSKTGNLPICAGEVDIYDVDMRYCFLRIPDIQLERIREAIIDVIIDPPPIDQSVIDFEKPEYWWGDDDDDYCGTVPRGPFPPKIDILQKLEKLPSKWAFAKERYQNLSHSVNRVNTSMQHMSAVQKREFLDTEFIEGVKVSKILYSNTIQFRNLLIDKFVSIRYWLCWWPWVYWLWWPYCGYGLEHLGTAVLKSDGSFDATLWLSVCRKDIPDLWFKVRQNINGLDRVIFARYPIPCNTYWNHPIGQEVHLLVTDPNAISCQQQPDPGYASPFVMPMGIYEDEWYQVDKAHIKAPVDPTTALPSDCGLYNSTDPYGTRLDLRMMLHDGIFTNIKYYRWSFRKHGYTEWIHIDTPISHRHIRMVTPGKYVIESVNLGPKTVNNAVHDLFSVPDPDLSWLSNRNDLAYAIWNTEDDSRVTDGKYDLRLQLFDCVGTQVKPSATTFKFILPTGVVGMVDDTLHVEPDGSLIMHLHVDNKDTVSDIKSVSLNGTPVGNCQFLEYTNKNTDQVTIEFEAYHKTITPNFMKDYRFRIRRGINAVSVASYNSAVPAIPGSPKQLTYFVSDLLGTYDKCAFTAWLHTFPRTRNGHSRIREYESSNSSAFALTQFKICPASILTKKDIPDKLAEL